MSEGVACRSCGTQNPPGRDFCEQCGEYLAWAPTALIAAVPGTRPAASPGAREPGRLADEEVSEPAPADPSPRTEVMPPAELGAATTAQAQAVPADPDTAAPAQAEVVPPADPVAATTAQAEVVPPADPVAPTPAPVEPDPEPPPAEPAPPAAEQLVGFPESPPPTGDASLVLAPVDPVIGAAGVPAVEAGGTLAFRATVRNESTIVDNYDLAVLGLPEGWAAVTPAAAFLVPLGSGRGDSELELRIDIAPPREYRSTAGIWAFELVALSRTAGTLAARAIAHFEVLPFQAWSIEVVPAVKSGRFKARYRTAVRNDGNAEQRLWPAAMDDSGKLRRRFAAGRLALEAGEVGVDTLTVRPRIPKLVGRTTEHRIGVDVLATEPGVDEAGAAPSAKDKLAGRARQEGKKGLKTGKPPKPPVFKNPLKKLRADPSLLSKLRPGADPQAPVSGTQVVFRQRPLVPLWLIGLLALLAVAAVLVYLLWPAKTSVPSVVGAPDAFAAEKRLREENLVLAQPVERRVDPDAPPGSVVEQTPAAGTRVEEDSSVSIVVADGATKVEVPRLKGLTRTKADKRLRDDGLELGETQPADAPDSYIVRSQIPDAGLEVDGGTAVRVFLRKPPLTPKQKAAAKKKAKAKAEATAQKKAAGSDQVVIPPFEDTPVDDYQTKLEKLGLKPDAKLRISSTKAGTVLAVAPAVGKKVKKGAVVVVAASGGPAPIAIQEGTSVRVVNPVGGQELYPLPAPQGSAAEPSYVRGGGQVVYRSGSHIVLADDGKDAKFRTVYAGSDSLVRPTMASDGVTLALIRREEGDGDLCFGRLDLPDLGRLCLPDDGWDLDGRMSWRPDGKAILVAARLHSNPSVFAVREYHTNTAFATDPLKWAGRTATPTDKPGKGVLVMAYSLHGVRVAAVSNLATDRFELVLTRVDDLRLVQPIATGNQACDVAWRPDGIELTVVQADDACTQSTGKLVRFRRDAPKKTSPVADKGANPAYRADQL